MCKLCEVLAFHFNGEYGCILQYGKKKGGGVKHIPIGWDWWIGLVGNSAYYNYFLSVNGTKIHHGQNPSTDYLPHVMVGMIFLLLHD